MSPWDLMNFVWRSVKLPSLTAERRHRVSTAFVVRWSLELRFADVHYIRLSSVVAGPLHSEPVFQLQLLSAWSQNKTVFRVVGLLLFRASLELDWKGNVRLTAFSSCLLRG
jgi:hypothetical protein